MSLFLSLTHARARGGSCQCCPHTAPLRCYLGLPSLLRQCRALFRVLAAGPASGQAESLDGELPECVPHLESPSRCTRGGGLAADLPFGALRLRVANRVLKQQNEELIMLVAQYERALAAVGLAPDGSASTGVSKAAPALQPKATAEAEALVGKIALLQQQLAEVRHCPASNVFRSSLFTALV